MQSLLVASMFRHILVLSLIAVTSMIIVGQTAGRHYWTKTVVASESTCKLRIGDGVLSPDENNCFYSNHLEADSKLFLKSFEPSNPWARLELVNDSGNSFSIEISNRSSASFKRIFNSFFAGKSSENHYPTCNEKQMKDFLLSVGFPAEMSRNGTSEEWKLSASHPSVQQCGFDTAVLKFVKGKLESLYGTI